MSTSKIIQMKTEIKIKLNRITNNRNDKSTIQNYNLN